MSQLSFILCTRNRAAILPLALNSIREAAAAAPHLPLQVVLVDNGSSDDTATIASAWAAAAPCQTTIITEPRPGLAIARNAGLRAATGGVIAFGDDDCALLPDYFATAAALYEADTAPIMRGGRVELGDPADLDFTTKSQTTPATYDGRYPGGFIHGCNMIVTRPIVDAIGPFDERFGAGAPFRSGEDTDYFHRAFRAGFAVHYCPALVVRHFHGRRHLADIQRLCIGYDEGTGALYAKHLGDWGLTRTFLGTAYRTLREALGGPIKDPAIQQTYAAALRGNLRGMIRYASRRHSKKGGPDRD